MNPAPTMQIRVLAIDPFARGFGFVVLEGPENLIDWGTKEARKKKAARSLEHVTELIEHYQPNVMVMEDWTDKSCRRSLRVREFMQAVLELTASREVNTYSVSRRTVKATFSKFGVWTKDETADVISKCFPGLALRRPPVRKSWMSEDERMSIFDAAAFALTFLSSISSTSAMSQSPSYHSRSSN